MRWVLTLMLAAATLAPVQQGPALDRQALLTALEQRAITGIPRHLTHDEGERLQAAVTAGMTTNPNDLELAWAATRASFVIVPRVRPAIYDAAPSLALEALPPLLLPWKVQVSGVIDVSVDNGPWRPAAEIATGKEPTHVLLEKTFPAAGRPGFHVVRLRASLEFEGHPGSPRSDRRELLTLTYGVTGTSAAGQRVTTLLNSGPRAYASTFDPTLPAVALDTWLRTIVNDPDAALVWTGHWCEDRPGLGERQPESICARAMIGPSPDRGHAEVWVKIATVDTASERPAWTAVTPTLEGIDLMAPPRRSTVSLLRDLPFAMRSTEEAWPRGALSLDARSITLTPANPQPGEKVAIRAEVRNSGSADVHGMTIDVLAFDRKDGNPRLHQTFVRTIPAGQSVVIDAAATFPLGYGGVVVTLMPLTADATFVPLLEGDANGYSAAARLIRPDLAPAGYADLVRAAVGCKPGCAAVR